MGKCVAITDKTKEQSLKQNECMKGRDRMYLVAPGILNQNLKGNK
jgi:hypothetical protein